AAVTDALVKAGFDATSFDLGTDIPALIQALTPAPDVVFNALHGSPGEDGTVQGLLDLMGIAYTHSGVLASAIAMDKPMTKRLVEAAGVRTPKGKVVSVRELGKGHPLPPPYVVKPVAEGSTVGVYIVRPGENMPNIGADWAFGDSLLVEEYIAGRE